MKLYCGDCLEYMKTIEDNSIDLILTDPPYELDNHGGTNSPLAQRCCKMRDDIDFIAYGFDYLNVFNEFIRILKYVNIIMFCSNKQLSTIMSWWESRGYSVTLLVWKKTNPPPLCEGKYINDLEYILYIREKGAYWNYDAPIGCKYREKVHSIMASDNKLHPTEKPIEIIDQFVQLHCPINGIILDPFMGSGTTGVACKKLNRDFIGCEINEEYFNIASKRISGTNAEQETSKFEWDL